MIPYDELLEVMRSRRSVRRFAGQPVCREDLGRLLEAARWAPSNHNRQPWRFLVFEDREQIRSLARGVRKEMETKLKSLPDVAASYADELVGYATFFEDAPALLVALHKQPIAAAASLWHGVSQPSLVSGEPLSVAMAIQNLLLAAHALGLGACVLTAPLLAGNLSASIPPVPGFEITAFVAVGYPAETPLPPRRKSLEHIAEFRNDPPLTL